MSEADTRDRPNSSTEKINKSFDHKARIHTHTPIPPTPLSPVHLWTQNQSLPPLSLTPYSNFGINNRLRWSDHSGQCYVQVWMLHVTWSLWHTCGFYPPVFFPPVSFPCWTFYFIPFTPSPLWPPLLSILFLISYPPEAPYPYFFPTPLPFFSSISQSLIPPSSLDWKTQPLVPSAFLFKKIKSWNVIVDVLKKIWP